MIINKFVPISLGGQYSVAWLNMGVIVLLNILMTLITLYPTVSMAFQYMEGQLKSLCNQLNQAAYQMNQVPIFINQYIKQLYQSIIQHIQRGLIVMIDVIKNVILWLIDIYKSTYRCLIVFAINTILSVLTIITIPLQQITEFVLKGVDTLIDSIGFTLFRQDNASTLPTTLSNWTLSMEQTQQKVNQWSDNSMDTLHEWISQPFDHLQQKINSSIIHDTSMVNHSLSIENNNINWINQSSSSSSYIYITNEDSFYCNLTTIIQDLHKAESSIKLILHISVTIVIVLMIACIILKMMYLRYRQRYLQRLRFQVIDDILTKIDDDKNVPKFKEESSISTSSSRSLTQIQKNNILLKQEFILSYYGQVNQSTILFSILNYFFHTFRSSSASFSFTRWQQWLFFITQSNAFIYCFYIGTLGLLISYLLLFILTYYLQSIILLQLDLNIHEWMESTLNNATLLIQTELNTQWFTTNQWITTSEKVINNYLFGSIRDLATPINMTLDSTIRHLSELVNNTVEHTIMEQPGKEVIDCLFLNKLENLQQGIEWIIKNSYVQLPRLKFMDFPPLTFHLIDPVTSKSIFNTVEHQLHQQIFYYWVLVGLWFIGAFFGFIYVKKFSSV